MKKEVKKDFSKEALPKESIKITILIIILTILLIIGVIFVTPLISSTDNNKIDNVPPIINSNETNNNEWINIEKTNSESFIKLYKSNNYKSNEWIFIKNNDYINLFNYNLITEYNCISNDCEGIIMNEQYAIVNDNKKFYLYDYNNKKIKELDFSNINFDTYNIDKLISSKNELYGLVLSDKNNKKGYYSYIEKAITIPMEYDEVSLEYLKNSYIEFYKNDINNSNVKYLSIYVDIITGMEKITNYDSIEIISNDNNIYFLKKQANNNYNVYNYNGKLLLNGQAFSKELIDITVDGNLIIYSNNYATYNLYTKEGMAVAK